MFKKNFFKNKALSIFLLIILIRFYQIFISAWIGNNCRFYPTCSFYALESVRQHGGCRGLYFTLRRLIRCQPLCKGGVDLVPEKKERTHGY